MEEKDGDIMTENTDKRGVIELVGMVSDRDKLIEELVGALKSIQSDAEAALSDEWDRSDDGFFAQIELIKTILAKGE